MCFHRYKRCRESHLRHGVPHRFGPCLHCRDNKTEIILNTFKASIAACYKLWIPGGGQDLPYKQEDGFLRWELDAFTDDPHELGHRNVIGNQELAFVNVLDLGVGRLFYYHLRKVNKALIDSYSNAETIIPLWKVIENSLEFCQDIWL